MVKGVVKKSGRASGVPPRSAVDWENAALKAIAANGLRSLSIPHLARSLRVTKGSFYWHFRSLKGLIEASLRRWEEIDRAALEAVAQVEDPQMRLTALFVQAMESRDAHALYVALAGSAVPEAATILRRIFDRRLKFLVESYRQLGLDPLRAREQALLAYTAYVGMLHLRRQRVRGLCAEKDLAAYVAHAVRTLIPAARGRRGRRRVDRRRN